MNRRAWWALGVVLVLGSPLAVIWINRRASAARFEEQLQIARSEGIPVDAAGYRALIHPAADKENAASCYRAMKGLGSKSNDVSEAYEQVVKGQGTAAAKTVVQDRSADLALIDRAATLPRCWFNRPWERGSAVLMPELAYMKAAAKLLALRGAVKAAEGDVAGACADVQLIFVLAKHAGEEPHIIAQLVQEAILSIGLRCLADWSFAFRSEAYAHWLEESLKEFPKPNLRREFADGLWNTLSVIDLMSTPKGRQELGITEDQMPALDRAAPLLFNQGEARTNMVKAYRAYWKTLDDPIKNATAADEAWSEFTSAMWAFPAAADVYQKLAGFEEGEQGVIRIKGNQARLLLYRAALRALTPKQIPKKIATDDLLSPFDGKPVTYRFDGKQIEIEVSGAASKLTIPGKKNKP